MNADGPMVVRDTATLDVRHDSTPLQLLPEVRIGASEDVRYDFQRLGPVLAGTDGAGYFLHPERHELLIYRPGSRELIQAGRIGDGPGEFRMPIALGYWSGQDTIWVLDAVHRRFTLFTFQGDMIRTQAAPSPIAIGEHHRIDLPRHPLGTDSYLAQASPLSPSSAHDEIPVLRIRDSTVVNEVVRLPGLQSSLPVRVPPGSTEGGVFASPLPDGPIVLFQPNGARTYVIGRRAHSGTGPAAITVVAYRPDGGRDWAARIPYDPVPIPARLRDSIDVATRELIHRALDARKFNPSDADRIYRDSYRVPRFFPPVRSAVVSIAGEIWLEVMSREQGEWQYVMLQNGREQSRFTAPSLSRSQLRAAGGGFLWVVALDADDVPSILRYRVPP